MKAVSLVVVPPPFDDLELTPWLRKELRSDHAGESGAVWIYKGILKTSKDPVVLEFASHHLATEQRHLTFFEQWLPDGQKSRLIPIWRAAAFGLGALPALLGRRWVFVTIDAVEQFVVQHYQQQIDVLRTGCEGHNQLADVLAQFQAEEDLHRADAADRVAQKHSVLERVWQKIIDVGSRAAVALARLV